MYCDQKDHVSRHHSLDIVTEGDCRVQTFRDCVECTTTTLQLPVISFNLSELHEVGYQCKLELVFLWKKKWQVFISEASIIMNASVHEGWDNVEHPMVDQSQNLSVLSNRKKKCIIKNKWKVTVSLYFGSAALSACMVTSGQSFSHVLIKLHNTISTKLLLIVKLETWLNVFTLIIGAYWEGIQSPCAPVRVVQSS